MMSHIASRPGGRIALACPAVPPTDKWAGPPLPFHTAHVFGKEGEEFAEFAVFEREPPGHVGLAEPQARIGHHGPFEPAIVQANNEVGWVLADDRPAPVRVHDFEGALADVS